MFVRTADRGETRSFILAVVVAELWVLVVDSSSMCYCYCLVLGYLWRDSQRWRWEYVSLTCPTGTIVTIIATSFLTPPRYTFTIFLFFLTVPEIPMHPHVYSNGIICLDLLSTGHGWSPVQNVESVCVSIQSMLTGNTKNGSAPPPLHSILSYRLIMIMGTERPEGDSQFVMTPMRSVRDINFVYDDPTVWKNCEGSDLYLFFFVLYALLLFI